MPPKNLLNNEEILQKREREVEKRVIGDFEQWSKPYASRMKVDEKHDITYSLMDRGVLSIPDDMLEEAWELIRRDYQQPPNQRVVYPLSIAYITPPDKDPKKVLYFVFEEFDFPDEENWTEAKHIEVGKIIQRAMRQCNVNDCMLYGSTKISLDNVQKKYSGLHCHSRICISVEEAERLLALILRELNKTMPRTKAQKPWAKILDTQVVTGRKINCRPNFASKMITCLDCKASKDRLYDCVNKQCRNGKVAVNVVYTLSWVLNPDGSLNSNEFMRIKNDMVEELRVTFFRPMPGTPHHPDFTLPVDCPMPVEFSSFYKDPDTDTILLGKKDEKRMQNDALPPGAASGLWKNAPEIPKESPIFQRIVYILKTQTVQPHWRHVDVRKIKMRIDKKTEFRLYRVFVTGQGANVCLNRIPGMDGVPRHSSSNRIGFDFTHDGWSQFCWGGSKTTENRATFDRLGNIITCDKFHSKKNNLSLDDKMVLYPNMGVTKTKSALTQSIVYTEAEQKLATILEDKNAEFKIISKGAKAKGVMSNLNVPERKRRKLALNGANPMYDNAETDDEGGAISPEEAKLLEDVQNAEFAKTGMMDKLFEGTNEKDLISLMKKKQLQMAQTLKQKLKDNANEVKIAKSATLPTGTAQSILLARNLSRVGINSEGFSK